MTDREKFEAYFAPIAEGMKKCGVGAVGIARRKDNQWQGWQAALASQDDGWIEWAGGECPVADDVTVEVWVKDLCIYGPHSSSAFRWQHGAHGEGNEGYDIIAYRVVKP